MLIRLTASTGKPFQRFLEAKYVGDSSFPYVTVHGDDDIVLQ